MNAAANEQFHRFENIIRRKADEGLFTRGRTVTVTRAPGRLDLMGGIADYSGSLVLQYPIGKATFAAAQIADDSLIRIESIADAQSFRTIKFEADIADLAPSGRFANIPSTREYFQEDRNHSWAAYVLGAFPVLADAGVTEFATGSRILIYSDVPLGKGVSSSAALEVSVMHALLELYGRDNVINCRDLALLCQRVENQVVGAPCGVMDQMVSACGSENELLEILCQPAQLLGTVRLPDDVEIWGIDSGIRHSVAGSDYATVRTAAAMGYRIIADAAGLSVKTSEPGRTRIDDSRWNGYLANIDANDFSISSAGLLPEVVRGGEFLERYGGVSDPLAVVQPDATYLVRASTAHPVFENERVRKFASVLRSTNPDLRELGSLMYASHESYSACGLGSDGTDMLVELVRRSGEAGGLFGAKITGGGSGGTVAVLGRGGSGGTVSSIADEYRRASGRSPQIFSGSSPGASHFGTRVVDL